MSRGVAVFQAKVGQDTFGSAFSGAVEQFVEVLASQEQHVLDKRWLLLFGFGHSSFQKYETRPVREHLGGFRVVAKMGIQMARPALQPVDL